MREIVTKLEKELRVSFLYYIFSGSNIFSPSCIDDELQFPCMLATNKYFLIIRKVGNFNLDDLEFCQMDKNPIQVTFLNLLIQKMMRSGSLK